MTPTITPDLLAPRELTADFTFRHLQLELTRLDMLLHRQIRRQQRRRQAHNQSNGSSQNGHNGGEQPNLFQNFYVSDEQAYALLQRPFGQGTGENEQETAAYGQALQNINEQIQELAEEAESREEPMRLLRLVALFNLNRFELDTLLIALAPALDLRYEALYGYLHDDLSRKRPTVNLVLDLLCPPGPERLLKYGYFADDAPLFQHHLLQLEGQEQTLNQTVAPDAGLIAWLLGRYQTETETRPFLHFEAHPLPQDELLTESQLVQVTYAAQTTAVVVLRGRDALCQQLAAQQLAYQKNRPLLTLDLTEATRREKLPADMIRIALRDAHLTNAIPFITGWDTCLNGDAPPPHLVTLICDFADLLIIAGEEEWRPREIARQRRFLWFEFPVPDYDQRIHLLHFFIEAMGVNTAVDNPETLDLVGLATQFSLTTGQIRDLVHTAQDLAVGQQKELGREELFTAARAHSNPRLSTLANKVTPRHSWDDLVLPPDQVNMLRELLNTVRKRPFVLQQWGLGKKLTASAGLTVLFAGPPGTGKTMAAEVLAREMGQDLYKINLSSVVSKYIGETEKNLEKIFLEAESSNAILFFDEADAIFGKRSEVKDAHDRYANVEVSYLLQRMERYDGVTILATNLRANLDEAFMRRLQFAVDFPFPEIEDRRRIWEALMPTHMPIAPNLDFDHMAEHFRLSGGNIRNIIVSAAYLAATNGQVVKMEHLLHGARRELQKMGYLVDEEVMNGEW